MPPLLRKDQRTPQWVNTEDCANFYAMSGYHTPHSSAMSALQTPEPTRDEIDCQIAALEGRICYLREQPSTPILERHIALLERQKRELQHKLEAMAILVKPQPKSNGRVDGIEI